MIAIILASAVDNSIGLGTEKLKIPTEFKVILFINSKNKIQWFLKP